MSEFDRLWANLTDCANFTDFERIWQIVSEFDRLLCEFDRFWAILTNCANLKDQERTWQIMSEFSRGRSRKITLKN